MVVTSVVIGVDVGGTNTDAVIVAKSEGKLKIIAKSKTQTTSDVTTGVTKAIHLALIASRKENVSLVVQQVNIGTTQFINAVVECKHLVKVAVIRLCGTASRKLPPFSDFAKRLIESVQGSVFMLNGGYQFDGQAITPVDEEEVVRSVEILKAKGEKNIVVSGIFSPVRREQETRVAEIIRQHLPDASITVSHEIGKLGLLERENAAVLNECIKPLCSETFMGLRSALDRIGLRCPLFLTQNDGTILTHEKALRFPVLLFASGTTNSMRVAAFLCGITDAFVVDIGGTSTDVGLLLNGFPREAAAEVKIGGFRTNFRMPDVMSIGLGGGSHVSWSTKKGKSQMTVGPQSAGCRLLSEALVFEDSSNVEGRIVTATDIAVAAGMADIGRKENVAHLDRAFVDEAVQTIHGMLTVCVDKMRLNNRELPMILVGGGSIIVDKTATFDGISEVIVPDHYDVANAVGAALSQISATVDRVVDLEQYINQQEMDAKLSSVLKASPDVSVEQQKDMTDRVKTEIYQRAREGAIREIIETVKAEAIRAGATEESISVVEKEDIALTYIPGSATRIKVKVVGDMKVEESCEDCPITVVIDHTAEEAAAGIQTSNKTVSTTGTMLSYDDETIRIQEPEINTETGEWLLSTYDLECLSVGAGVMGCGGGGNPRLGLLLARKVLESGNTIRVVTPERFLCSAVHADDKVAMVAVMGAPLIAHEKLMAGNELEGALQSMLELYENGNYNDADGDLHVTDDTDVNVGDGVVYIDNYPPKTRVGRSCLAAVMSCEVGGLNCMEPLRVAAELGVPVLDCDGMGRAFPELQMFTPFIYGFKPYPATMADDKGRRAVVLKVDSPNRLEKHFRDVTISMGCSSGVCFAAMRVQDVMKYTVRHSLSQAWRIGDTVLRARASDGDPVAAVIEAEAGRNLIYGKVTDVLRETTGGFNIGKIDIDGLDVDTGRRITVEFKNEFIVVREMSCIHRRVLASVPDLIALLDADTAQPIPTEEVGFGMRVAVVGFRVNPMMSSDEALKFVGPKAFGLTDVEYVPIGEFKDRGSIAPL